MIQLPRHLAPWGPELAIFAEPMSLSIGRLVVHLSALLGGERAAEVAGGEPAGYDGIDRRGPYARLLASEWLLADAVPDEFLRRAIAGEHAFLRRAHTGEAGSRRAVALFDAGPDQLGAPRLGHLAVLILLASSARRQRAVLEWGVLQDPVGPEVGLTEANVRVLLRGRSLRPAADEDVDRWLAAMGPAPGCERWLVGGDLLARRAGRAGARTVRIDDVADPEGPQRIRLAVDDEARARAVTLEVPPERTAVQLLRDPFRAAAAAPAPRPERKGPRSAVSFDPASSLVFACDGRRLYLRGTGPEVIGLHVPNSASEAAGRPSVFDPADGETALAVGRAPGHAGRSLIVTRVEADGTYRVHTVSRRGATIGSRSFLPQDDGSYGFRRPDLVPAISLLATSAVHLIGPTGALLELSAGRIRTVAAVAALEPRISTGCLRWVTVRERVPCAARAIADRGVLRLEEEIERGAPPMHGEHFAMGGGGVASLLAYPTSPTCWRILERSEATVTETIVAEVPEDSAVVGVMRLGSRPTLVVLDPPRTRVSLVGAEATHLAPTTTAPIVRAMVGPRHETVAFMTSAAEVLVYHGEKGVIVMRAGALP